MNADSMKLRVVFTLVMATLMVTLLTFVLGPLRQLFAPNWAWLWLQMWLTAFPVAVPAVWVLAPVARRIALRLCGIQAPAPNASNPPSHVQESTR